MPSKPQSNEIIYNNPEPLAFAPYVDGVRIGAPYMKSLALTL